MKRLQARFPYQSRQVSKSYGVLLVLCLGVFPKNSDANEWRRHVIDDAYRGADGVRIADFNDDGLPDLVTGWEESGIVRLYLHPGKMQVREPWPAVTVGNSRSPEDAVPVDLDGDGRLDVVSCHEGNKRQVLVHWNHADDQTDKQLLDKDTWRTERFSQLDGQQWMFAEPLTLASGKLAVAVGSKNNSGSITLLIAPESDQRKLRDWQAIRLREAGWIMTLRAVDMNDDGRTDLAFTDRKGPLRKAAWLEQPTDVRQRWIEHTIAGAEQEVMFMSVTPQRCLVAVRNDSYLDCRRTEECWNTRSHPNPRDLAWGKAIAPLEKDRLVLTLNTTSEKENGKPVGRPGIWIQNENQTWKPIDTTTRTKFDRIEVRDLDQDGDLDVITCEERRNLGIVWYENPLR